MSRIQQTFSALNGAKALIPYITVGDPSLETTLALMHSLVANGADILELGVPFLTRWQMARLFNVRLKERWQIMFLCTMYWKQYACFAKPMIKRRLC